MHLHPHIKSFVRREGRLTPGQKKALDNYATTYCLPTDQGLLNLNQIFSNPLAPIALEIGFGMGHSLLNLAKTFPEKNFLGIEVYRPGVGTVLSQLAEENISNVKIFPADAMLVLPNCIPDNSLDTIYIFFPDPWPKTRHHKRRLVQLPFIELCVRKLKSGGLLHLATDWEDYAHHMMEVLSTSPTLTNLDGPNNFSPTRGDRPTSKYELRGQRLQHGVWDLRFKK